jgi:hypothetical protein
MAGRKRRLKILRWIYESVILILGGMSLVFLVGCLSRTHDPQIAKLARSSKSPTNQLRNADEISDTKDMRNEGSNSKAISSTIKVPSQNPYQPDHRMVPVAYGILPDEYRTLVVPDSNKNN